MQCAARPAAPRRPAAVQLFACRHTVIRPCSLRSQAGRTMAVNSGLNVLLAGTMLPMLLQGSNHAAVCSETFCRLPAGWPHHGGQQRPEDAAGGHHAGRGGAAARGGHRRHVRRRRGRRRGISGALDSPVQWSCLFTCAFPHSRLLRCRLPLATPHRESLCVSSGHATMAGDRQGQVSHPAKRGGHAWCVLQGGDPLHYARTAGPLKPEVLRPLLAPDLPCFKVLCTTHVGSGV